MLTVCFVQFCFLLSSCQLQPDCGQNYFAYNNNYHDYRIHDI